MVTKAAGKHFTLVFDDVVRAVESVDPEPVHEHYVVVGGRRFPPKQVLAAVTGLDRAELTTHQARSVLLRLAFGGHRRTRPAGLSSSSPAGPHGGAEAAMLETYSGRWIAQEGPEVLYDADGPQEVVRWLRRHGRRARVWRVPVEADEAGSALAAP